MAKRSKALEDRLRESEAREKRAREDAQVTGLFELSPGQNPAVTPLQFVAPDLLVSPAGAPLPDSIQVRRLCHLLWFA